MNPNTPVLGEVQSQLLALLDESDLQVDVFRGASPNGANSTLMVRIIHKPTGFVETCGDYQTRIENQLVALARLANQIFKPE